MGASTDAEASLGKNRSNDLQVTYRNADGNTDTDAHRIRNHVADFKAPPAGGQLSEFQCDSESRGSNCGGYNQWSPLVHGRQESQHHITGEM